MNEAIANQNQGTRTANWAPRLSFYHPTQRGTGSAIAFEISPATGDAEGMLYVSAAAQNPTPETVVVTPTGKRCASFLWKSKICVKFTFTETAEILMVLAGQSKCAVHAGKDGFYHASAEASTMIDVAQSDDPARPGAVMVSFTKVPKAAPDSKQRIAFCLSPSEVFGLRLALEQSMSLLAFGMTNSDSSYARRLVMPRGALHHDESSQGIAQPVAAGAEGDFGTPF